MGVVTPDTGAPLPFDAPKMYMTPLGEVRLANSPKIAGQKIGVSLRHPR